MDTSPEPARFAVLFQILDIQVFNTDRCIGVNILTRKFVQEIVLLVREQQRLYPIRLIGSTRYLSDALEYRQNTTPSGDTSLLSPDDSREQRPNVQTYQVYTIPHVGLIIIERQR